MPKDLDLRPGTKQTHTWIEWRRGAIVKTPNCCTFRLCRFRQLLKTPSTGVLWPANYCPAHAHRDIFLNKTELTVPPRPPYSSDLVLSGFFILAKLRTRDADFPNKVFRQTRCTGLPFEEVNSVPELLYCATCITRVTALLAVGSEVQSFWCKRGSVGRSWRRRGITETEDWRRQVFGAPICLVPTAVAISAL